MKSKKEIKAWFNTHGVFSFDYLRFMSFLINKGYSKKSVYQMMNMVPFRICDLSFDDFVNWFESKDVKKDCDNCKLYADIGNIIESIGNLYSCADIDPITEDTANRLECILRGTLDNVYHTISDIEASDILERLELIKKSIPPTPKFKIGDWVRHKDGGVYKITGTTVWGSMGACYNCSATDRSMGVFGFRSLVKESELELWIPKDDEFYVYDKEYNVQKVICCGKFSCCDFLSNHKYIGINHSNNPRPAMREEIDVLMSAVNKKYGKIWNGKEWIDVLKVGDIGIVWDVEKCNAIIGVLVEINHPYHRPYHVGDGFHFKHCIKFHSIEQYREFIK